MPINAKLRSDVVRCLRRNGFAAGAPGIPMHKTELRDSCVTIFWNQWADAECQSPVFIVGVHNDLPEPTRSLLWSVVGELAMRVLSANDFIVDRKTFDSRDGRVFAISGRFT